MANGAVKVGNDVSVNGFPTMGSFCWRVDLDSTLEVNADLTINTSTDIFQSKGVLMGSVSFHLIPTSIT